MAEIHSLSPAVIARVLLTSSLALRALGGPGSGIKGHTTEHEHGEGRGSAAWFNSLEKIGSAKGSNPGGLYKDASGQKWYVKNYRNADQANTEQVANDLYRAVGAKVPETVVSPTGQFASKWESDKVGTLGNVGLTKETSNRILDHAVADVFVANWDAVGTGHDNILIGKDGSVTRIDQGGTLLFRAQGALKPESGLAGIGEWNSLSNPSTNSYYARVFSSAGVKNMDALGSRAVKQINAIAAARPAAGWASFVRSSVPHASASFVSKVGSMLESRQALLQVKARELSGRSLQEKAQKRVTSELPISIRARLLFLASGNWGHAGRPGEVGGSAPSEGSEAGSAQKQKNAPATKEMKATAFAMHKAGKKHGEIAAALGMHPNTVAHVIIKQKAIAAALAKGPVPAVVQTPVSPSSSPVGGGKSSEEKISSQPSGAGKASFEKEFTKFPNGDIYSNSALATSVSPSPLYLWKEKTSGPQAGKYAYFQNGMQVSSAFPKEDHGKAVSTIHQGKGPGYVAPMPAGAPPVAKSEYKFVEPTGKATLADVWPIGHDVERDAGTLYPKKMDEIGHAWAAGLTVGEKAAVKSYTGAGSHSINAALRLNPNVMGGSASRIASALAKAPTPPPPELVWRGAGSGSEKLFASLSAGDVIRMNGFQSTSISPSSAWSGVKLEIKPKAGAYVKVLSAHKGEHEFLLPHGRTYVVHGITEIKLKHGGSMKVVQLAMQ